jgi:hypothetical protein
MSTPRLEDLNDLDSIQASFEAGSCPDIDLDFADEADSEPELTWIEEKLAELAV